MKIRIKNEQTTMKTFPLPVTLVSSVDKQGNPNIMVVTYVTGVNENPPMIAIAVRREKYSNRLIKETKEFVVNIPTADILSKVDYCGTYSGKHLNKFEKAVLTPEKAVEVKPPLIKECPINIECKVMKVINLPSHDLFIGKVVALHGNEIYIHKNELVLDNLSFILTTFFDYRIIGEKIGTAFNESGKISLI